MIWFGDDGATVRGIYVYEPITKYVGAAEIVVRLSYHAYYSFYEGAGGAAEPDSAAVGAATGGRS
jgi:hypothetical protein